ncbi:MAG: hypothetical protein P4L51_20100 [Puia sp.]|nr:hypothetical protein [Puia sp.]
MVSFFSIVLRMRTSSGFERFGVFELGTDRGFAVSLFTALEGSEDISETDIVQLDFVETKNNLPLNLRLKACSANQLAANCRIITKELFKRWNIDVQ